MKYKIEIWQWHSITETYESDDINEILKWYKENWDYCYQCGNCTFSVYKNDKNMTFDELNKLGFFDW